MVKAASFQCPKASTAHYHSLFFISYCLSRFLSGTISPRSPSWVTTRMPHPRRPPPPLSTRNPPPRSPYPHLRRAPPAQQRRLPKTRANRSGRRWMIWTRGWGEWWRVIRGASRRKSWSYCRKLRYVKLFFLPFENFEYWCWDFDVSLVVFRGLLLKILWGDGSRLAETCSF